MTPSRFDRFLPLSGVLAGIGFAAVNVLTWGAPDSTDAAEVSAWIESHETRAVVAAFLLAYVAVLLAFFAVATRQAVRSGEPGESTYSSAVFAGGVMLASSAGLWSFVQLAQGSAVNDKDAAAVSAMAHLNSVVWMPWLLASVVLFLSLGLGGLRTASLPRWLAFATLALGVLGLTGVGGIAVYLVMPVWLVVTGVVLHNRLGGSGGTVDSENAGRQTARI